MIIMLDRKRVRFAQKIMRIIKCNKKDIIMILKVLSLLCVGALFIWLTVEGKEDVPVADQLYQFFSTGSSNTSDVR